MAKSSPDTKKAENHFDREREAGWAHVSVEAVFRLLKCVQAEAPDSSRPNTAGPTAYDGRPGMRLGTCPNAQNGDQLGLEPLEVTAFPPHLFYSGLGPLALARGQAPLSGALPPCLSFDSDGRSGDTSEASEKPWSSPGCRTSTRSLGHESRSSLAAQTRD